MLQSFCSFLFYPLQHLLVSAMASLDCKEVFDPSIAHFMCFCHWASQLQLWSHDAQKLKNAGTFLWQKMCNQHVTILLTSQNWTQRSSTMEIWFMGYNIYSQSTHKDSRINDMYPQWAEELTWCQDESEYIGVSSQNPMEYQFWDKNKEEYQSQNIMVQSEWESI